MLQITVPARESMELYDEKNDEFISIPSCKEQTLSLEHSLISLSKWESKWCKPFFSIKEKTGEETIDYIKCMTLTPNVKPDVWNRLTQENIQQISEYIEAPMTATTFYDDKSKRGGQQTVTSELIYYWMIELKIPVEFEKWHINRLLTLIRICEIKSRPPKKMKQGDLINQYAAINEARKKILNTRG